MLPSDPIASIKLPLKGLNEKSLVEHEEMLEQSYHSITSILKKTCKKDWRQRGFEELILLNKFIMGYGYFIGLVNEYGQDLVFKLS